MINLGLVVLLVSQITMVLIGQVHAEGSLIFTIGIDLPWDEVGVVRVSEEATDIDYGWHGYFAGRVPQNHQEPCDILLYGKKSFVARATDFLCAQHYYYMRYHMYLAGSLGTVRLQAYLTIVEQETGQSFDMQLYFKGGSNQDPWNPPWEETVDRIEHTVSYSNYEVVAGYHYDVYYYWFIHATVGSYVEGTDPTAPAIVDWGDYVAYPGYLYLRYYDYVEPPPPGGGGGCPYVSTWNGTHYVLDNNLMPEAEYSNGNDVIDHYKLQQPLTHANGSYSLLVWDLDKHSFLDQIELMAVDHESDVKVALSPSGEILTFKDPTPPTTAFDKDGNDISDLLNAPDGQYHQGYEGDYIQLDFSGTDIKNEAKLVIISDGCWIAPPCHMVKSPVYVQTKNSTETWQTVATIYPRFFWSTDIIDLSEHLPDLNGELRIRMVYTSEDKIDYVGLDTTKQGEFEVRHGRLAKAIQSAHSDVKDVLMHSDDAYTELLPGEEITLKFTVPRSKEDVRDLIIVVEGHYFTVPA